MHAQHKLEVGKEEEPIEPISFVRLPVPLKIRRGANSDGRPRNMKLDNVYSSACDSIISAPDQQHDRCLTVLLHAEPAALIYVVKASTLMLAAAVLAPNNYVTTLTQLCET